MTWREAVWAAVLRQAGLGDVINRQVLLAAELPRIVAEVGSQGATPAQTLSRVLQELRAEGVVLFDGNGNYRVAAGLAGQPLEIAVATEALRLQKSRIGQGRFRAELLARWGGACPLTGITEPALLRASHIVPWNCCETDAERLNPDNGLLLSALWDAAFDQGLVVFDDSGVAASMPGISPLAFRALGIGKQLDPRRLTQGNFERLRRHRSKWHGGIDASY